MTVRPVTLLLSTMMVLAGAAGCEPVASVSNSSLNTNSDPVDQPTRMETLLGELQGELDARIEELAGAKKEIAELSRQIEQAGRDRELLIDEYSKIIVRFSGLQKNEDAVHREIEAIGIDLAKLPLLDEPPTTLPGSAVESGEITEQVQPGPAPPEPLPESEKSGASKEK